MSAHTPGPWIVNPDRPREVLAPATHPEFPHLTAEGRAAGTGDPQVAEANARLIAAAPDLLDAAEIALQLCVEAGLDKTVPRALDIVRRAIAEAKGATT